MPHRWRNGQRRVSSMDLECDEAAERIRRPPDSTPPVSGLFADFQFADTSVLYSVMQLLNRPPDNT